MGVATIERWESTHTPLTAQIILKQSSHCLWVKSSYSCYNPKIGCHGNLPLFLTHQRVLVEFIDSRNPISEPNRMLMSDLELKLSPFLCDFRSFFKKNSLPWQNPLIFRCQKCIGWIGQLRRPPLQVITLSLSLTQIQLQLVDMVTSFVPYTWEYFSWVPVS